MNLIKNKKASVSGFIIMIVFLFIGLLAFVLFMPLGLPFINVIAAGDYDPLTKFLFIGIPLFTVISLVVGTVVA